MEKYILSLDQGTTSSRAILFDREGQLIACAQKEFRQLYPKPGWVEHDPREIWSTQLQVAKEGIKEAGEQVAALGITNQRETTVVWDRESGEPVYNAIVWQDRRTSDYCDRLKDEGWGERIRGKTGLVIDAYFSATKIKWILEHVARAREKAKAGKLAFGTIDSWLIWNLTGGKVHITDVTNASRTMLYNIHTLEWDEELLQLFDIPAAILPEVRSSSEVYGETEAHLLGAEIPIAGIAGDQQAALFGQMCTKTGMVKNTYGTGCFMLMNVGDKPVLSTKNLVTTIAWKLNGQVRYALEGSIFIGGAVVQWLRDGLGLIASSGEVEELAGGVEDSGGVYIVPAFTGLGAPHWDQHARGTIVGMTRGTTAAHLARAALESIAFQTMDILEAMAADSGVAIEELRVDGGATANDLLMQFQADILGAEVIRPQITEVTALGAAYLAGLAIGYWDSPEAIQQQWKIDRGFQPGFKPDLRLGFQPEENDKKDEMIRGWNRAIKAARAWAATESESGTTKT